MKKKLLFSILLVGLLIISVLIFLPRKVNAQGALPIGGNSFETAVPLSPGEYQGGVLEDGKDWYYSIGSDIHPGQEIQTQLLFTGNTSMSVTLYDQNKQKLSGKEYEGANKTIVVGWPNGSSKLEKCYLRLANTAIWSATLQNVSVKVINRFDADSQTDAGGSFENALPIEAGQYKSFLDFNYEASDGEDFYKTNVARGQKLTVRATPPQGLRLNLKIYDKDRKELVDESSENEGAIVTGSIQALAANAFYIAVAPEYGSEQDQASQYTLDISGATPNTQKSGVANVSDSPLSQVGSSFLGSIGKSIKFILLIVATVLIVIVVTVALLLKGKSSRKEMPKEKVVVKAEEVKEEKKEPVKVKTPEFVYCSKCGAKNPQGAQFCSKCGEQLK